MTASAASYPGTRSETVAGYCVWAFAVAIAMASARDYAGGWNDGSRLATVECLVDYGTFAIDDSIFVKVPPVNPRRMRPLPYLLDDTNTWQEGTQDKILVDGHYYSHRSPVPAVLLAGWYFLWQKMTGFTAKEHCGEFCYWMNLGSAGLPYVVAVVCCYYLAARLGLPLRRRLALATSLAIGTVALPYASQVNDHIMLLGVAAALALLTARNAVHQQDATAKPARSMQPIGISWALLGLTGALSGLAYTIDQGAGPPLLAAIALLIAYRTGFKPSSLAVFVTASVPWLVAHHAINYAIGGALKPIGSEPKYFEWPGSPFGPENMTGIWNHPSLPDFLRYAVGLMFEPTWGFFWHNLPLLLTLTGIYAVWKRRPAEAPELATFGAWSAATWLVYSALSVNHSGDCCSVRWFVPLLAAGYYLLAVLIRDDARYNFGFLALTAPGIGLGACMWLAGPWHEPPWPLFRWLQLTGAVSWIAWMVWARFGRAKPATLERPGRHRQKTGALHK